MKSSIKKYVLKKEDVIRITVIDLPQERLPGEGLYEWRFMTDKHYMDMITLEKEIKDKAPEQDPVRILDRLQNFRRVFINLHTGEVSS